MVFIWFINYNLFFLWANYNLFFLWAFQVDKERLVRKQSLHVLKAALQISEEIQLHYDVSEKKKSQEKNSVPRAITKRDVWADKEAKSLGVGKICYFDSFLNNYQQWEAFVLLYEMFFWGQFDVFLRFKFWFKNLYK